MVLMRVRVGPKAPGFYRPSIWHRVCIQSFLFECTSVLFNLMQVRKELDQWGLKLQPNLVELQGRILPEENITQGGKTFPYQRHLSDWSREIRSE